MWKRIFIPFVSVTCGLLFVGVGVLYAARGSMLHDAPAGLCAWSLFTFLFCAMFTLGRSGLGVPAAVWKVVGACLLLSLCEVIWLGIRWDFPGEMVAGSSLLLIFSLVVCSRRAFPLLRSQGHGAAAGDGASNCPPRRALLRGTPLLCVLSVLAIAVSAAVVTWLCHTPWGLVSRAFAAQDRRDYERVLAYADEMIETTGRVEQESWWIRGLVLKSLTLHEIGRNAEALDMWRREVDLLRKSGETEQPVYVSLLARLASAQEKMGLYAKAEETIQEAETLCRERPEECADDLELVLSVLAHLRSRQGDHEAAERLFREQLALMEDDTDSWLEYPRTLAHLALSLSKQDRTDAALEVARQVSEYLDQAGQERTPDMGSCIHNLAVVYRRAGDEETALSYYREAQGIFREELSEQHPEYADTSDELAGFLTDLGELEEAEDLLTGAIATYAWAYGENHPVYAMALYRLANVRIAQERHGDAELLLEQSLDILDSRVADTDHRRGIVAKALRSVYAQTGHLEKTLRLPSGTTAHEPQGG